MTLLKVGTSTLGVEVAGITGHGVWLILNNKEFFLPYGEFPWFRKAIIDETYEVELLHEKHLYWPNPDVDTHLDNSVCAVYHFLIHLAFQIIN
jgi:hypothetical protein